MKILSKPKYVGYKVKCPKCKTEFIGKFYELEGCAYEYFRCPSCDSRIEKRFWWRKV